jgi:hypothetical protein
MKIVKNPAHKQKLQLLNTAADFTGDFLKLDQTTPQTTVGTFSFPKVNVNNIQAIYVPDQTNFTGSVFFGNGGVSLSHTTDEEGRYNTGVGLDALLSNTTGAYNVAFGRALRSNTTGVNNMGIGSFSLNANVDGNNNVAVGVYSLGTNISGTGNIGIGQSALFNNKGYYNTGIGNSSGFTKTTGDGNVFIGYQSGYYETGSNKLFIDNTQRASEADGRAKALIYGVFDAAVANQRLTINGLVGIGTTAPTHTLTLPSTSTGIVLYNTADQTTNYERFRLSTTQLTHEIAGNGVERQWRYVGNGVEKIAFPAGQTNGAVKIAPASGASSGTVIGLNIAQALTQSGTAGYTALLINPTETATGSGAKNLIDARVGSVSKFKVDNAGNTTAGSVIANDLTANQIVATDANKKLQTLAVATYPSLTELSYVKGLSSAVQTQINALPSASSTTTFTNKRYTKRVLSAASASSVTPEISTYDIWHYTALAADITFNNHSTSTPTDGERIQFRLLDNGTARQIYYGTNYVAKAGIPLPLTTVVSKNLTMMFEWNTNLSKYNLIAVGQED